MLLAAQAQAQHVTLPVMHLHAMNPSVAAVVGDAGVVQVRARWRMLNAVPEVRMHCPQRMQHLLRVMGYSTCLLMCCLKNALQTPSELQSKCEPVCAKLM